MMAKREAIDGNLSANHKHLLRMAALSEKNKDKLQRFDRGKWSSTNTNSRSLKERLLTLTAFKKGVQSELLAILTGQRLIPSP